MPYQISYLKMLSKQTRYAMLATIFLARRYGGEKATIAQIAESERIPQRVLERILLKLKNRGYLESVRGKVGGYLLACRPEDITLLDIVILFEDSVSMLACLCTDDEYRECEFCKDEATCPIRSTFAGIYHQTVEVLRTTTLADIIADTKKENL